MIKNIIVLAFLSLLYSPSLFASSISGGGGPVDISALEEAGACTDDHFIRWDDAGGVFQCEAAPGAAGGDAWTSAVDSDILPTANDNVYDLGSVAASFADAHIQGTATIGTATISTAGTVAGSAIATAASTTTFTNKTIDADGTGNSISNIENADIKAAAAIDAAKIHDASVSNTEFGYVNGVTSAIQTQLDGKAPTDGDGIVDQICGHIETPSNKTYWPVLKSKYPFTINEITTDVDSGTISMQLEIDGVAVTGCSTADIAVTTTESDDTCSAANVLSTGNDLTIVTTSNSSSDDLRFCIKITRD